MEPNRGFPGDRIDSFADRFLTSRLTTRQLNQWAIIFAVLTVFSCLCSVVTFFNPQVFFNVLEPSRIAPRALPTITPSPLRYPTLPPEWTATPVPSASPTHPTDTATPVPSDTPTITPTGPTATPSRTTTPTRTASPTRTPTRTRTPTKTRKPTGT